MLPNPKKHISHDQNQKPTNLRLVNKTPHRSEMKEKRSIEGGQDLLKRWLLTKQISA